MQTDFSQAPSAAFAGLAVNAMPYANISRTLASRQLYQIINTGQDGSYTVSINGTQVAAFTASTNTAAQIRDDLLADIQASSAPVVATASSTDKILLEALGYTEDDEFTVTIASVTGFAATELVAQGESVPFGVGVCRDERAEVTGEQCRLPRLSTDISAGFLGVSLADVANEPNDLAGWANNQRMTIRRQGYLYVVVENAVSELAQLYCRYTATGSQQLGAFRSDGDSSTAGAAPVRAMKATTGAGIVLAEVIPAL